MIMDKYHKNNKLEFYNIYALLCSVLVGLSTVITIYLVLNSFKKFKEAQRQTYVFSSNGASIYVYQPK